ncbi:hypothetical protein Cni_G17281 [Canna indica]|uniref:Uncharacterized protein n=1 Tax=Canna indica TaxID=4628 RepID=A0AAQ3KKE2_9LILI|nr:hypothetical protein Cni_G17281 [Canna indica]
MPQRRQGAVRGGEELRDPAGGNGEQRDRARGGEEQRMRRGRRRRDVGGWCGRASGRYITAPFRLCAFDELQLTFSSALQSLYGRDPNRLFFRSSPPEDCQNPKRNNGAKLQLGYLDAFREDGFSHETQENKQIGKVGRTTSCKRNISKCSSRDQLEQDVQRLQQMLDEEMELHVVLENALEHAAAALSDFTCLPNDAKELLSNIASLEMTVSRLEEEMISLHFQLIQERNERRLAEYRLKQLPVQPTKVCSTKNDTISSMLVQEEKSPEELFQNVQAESFRKQIPVKGLWNHPNQLSEEIVRCMKNIFISLADVSMVSSRSSASEIICFPLSPGNISNSSNCSISEQSISSWAHSPRVGLQYNNELLATGTTFDPYRAQGKLCWSDIGNYSLATEVSWMSVEKKQLEYAAGALRRFRSLIEQLAEVNPVHLKGDEKLAFWINLYNALIMHAYLAYGVPRSDMKLFSLMQKAAYTVGGHSYSAACIEYGILKMKPPVHRPQTALLLALHKLKLSEEQKFFSVETFEPLVAFALSCGSYSSPAVKVYTPVNVKEELQEAQRDFIRASVGISSKGKLLVPKMLYCFVRGIVDDSNFATWISQFLPPKQANFVQLCMSQRRQRFLGSRNFGVLPFDSRFRYLFLPEKLT